MENPYYRAELVRLMERFGDKGLLNQKEVAEYLGLNPRTVKTRYGIGKSGIAMSKLAVLITRN